MEDGNFNDKVIVITGASSGFGKGAALKFADQVARLVLAARRDEVLDGVAHECETRGASALAVATDVSVREDVERLAQSALQKFGRIDGWINNAGVGALGRFEAIPLDIHETGHQHRSNGDFVRCLLRIQAVSPAGSRRADQYRVGAR